MGRHIAVVGGGIIGSMVAARLVDADDMLRVTLIEASLVAGGASMFSAGVQFPVGRSARVKALGVAGASYYDALRRREPLLPIYPLAMWVAAAQSRSAEVVASCVDLEAATCVIPGLAHPTEVADGLALWRLPGCHVSDVTRVAQKRRRLYRRSGAVRKTDSGHRVMLHSAFHPALGCVSGTGIVALRDVCLGTVVWGPCPTCQVLDTAQRRALPPEVTTWVEEYGYRLAGGQIMLPCKGAHLLNHSCDAAVLDYGLAVGIAVRDIRAGDEVTIDYRTFHCDLPWQFACSCGTPSCTGIVRSSPGGISAQLAAEWQRLMAPALLLAPTLPQEIALRKGSVVSAEPAVLHP